MVKDKCTFGVGTTGGTGQSLPGPIVLASHYFECRLSFSALICSKRSSDKITLRPLLMDFLVASVVQNLLELLQLPGLEEDRTFQKEIGLKTLVFKAYRYWPSG